MSILKREKLNQLLAKWTSGTILTSQWLGEHGYSPQLMEKYLSKGWVHRVGPRAYSRAGDIVSWKGAVNALQKQMNMPVHVGGLNALELHGLAQYIAFDESKITLFNTSAKKKILPSWVEAAFPHIVYIQKHLINDELGLEVKKIDGVEIILSSAELAILEILSLVPHAFDYAHAYDLVENMQLLRPELIQQLLLGCLSIKVKRLFLFLAEKHQLPCFSHLKIDDIDLGNHKQMIGEGGGSYIAKYKLSVPRIRTENEIEDV